jgi:hypothetical protein
LDTFNSRRSRLLGELSDLSPEQPLDEILTGQGEVLCHVAQLAAFESGQAEVTTSLAGYPVAEIGESLREAR